MLRPDLKLKYELHYNSTNATGARFSGFEKTSFKLIYFPSQKPLNDTWTVKSALGLEWYLFLVTCWISRPLVGTKHSMGTLE